MFSELKPVEYYEGVRDYWAWKHHGPPNYVWNTTMAAPTNPYRNSDWRKMLAWSEGFNDKLYGKR